MRVPSQQSAKRRQGPPRAAAAQISCNAINPHCSPDPPDRQHAAVAAAGALREDVHPVARCQARLRRRDGRGAGEGVMACGADQAGPRTNIDGRQAHPAAAAVSDSAIHLPPSHAHLRQLHAKLVEPRAALHRQHLRQCQCSKQALVSCLTDSKLAAGSAAESWAQASSRQGTRTAVHPSHLCGAEEGRQQLRLEAAVGGAHRPAQRPRLQQLVSRHNCRREQAAEGRWGRCAASERASAAVRQLPRLQN